MTRDHDGDGVGSVGGAHCAHGFGGSNGRGDLSVAPGFPVGDRLQLPPDALLKIRSLHVQGQVEFPQLSSKICLQLSCSLAEQGVGVVARAWSGWKGLEFNGANSRFACNQSKPQIVYKLNLGPLEHGNSLPHRAPVHAVNCRRFTGIAVRTRLQSCYNWFHFASMPLKPFAPNNGADKKIFLLKPRGFCAGVVRAIDVVKIALDLYGPPVYVRKEIVHNKHVVDELREAGAIFVEELDEVPAGARAIFSAHGVAPSVRRQAKQRSLEVIDATCPLVTKVHLEAVRFAR